MIDLTFRNILTIILISATVYVVADFIDTKRGSDLL